MGTISNTVQHRIDSCWQKQMKFDELMQLECGDVADCFCKTKIKYWMPKLMVPAIAKPQTDMTAATPLLTTFGELMETLDIVPGISQMPQGMS